MANDFSDILNIDSFQPSGAPDRVIPTTGTAFEQGTVELTLGRETRRVPAERSRQDGRIIARGISGRYQTGGKVWPARISYAPEYLGKPGLAHLVWDCHFGRYDNHHKFQKTNIFFGGGK